MTAVRCDAVYHLTQHRPGSTEQVDFECVRRQGHTGKHQAMGADYKADGSGHVQTAWAFSWESAPEQAEAV